MIPMEEIIEPKDKQAMRSFWDTANANAQVIEREKEAMKKKKKKKKASKNKFYRR